MQACYAPMNLIVLIFEYVLASNRKHSPLTHALTHSPPMASNYKLRTSNAFPLTNCRSTFCMRREWSAFRIASNNDSDLLYFTNGAHTHTRRKTLPICLTILIYRLRLSAKSQQLGAHIYYFIWSDWRRRRWRRRRRRRSNNYPFTYVSMVLLLA